MSGLLRTSIEVSIILREHVHIVEHHTVNTHTLRHFEGRVHYSAFIEQVVSILKQAKL